MRLIFRFFAVTQVQINGIFRDLQLIGNPLNRILDVENTLFVQVMNNGLVTQSRAAEAFTVSFPRSPLHSL